MSAADQARTEAEQQYRLWSPRDDAQAFRQQGFIAGAVWQASRPITDAQVEMAARAMFAEEQCDRHQKRTAVSLEENWITRLDDRDREEYRSLARAALEVAKGADS